jgi:molybdopterin molybdotransferase
MGAGSSASAAEAEQGAPGAGEVRESNGAMLVAALEADGARARHLTSGDEPAQLRAALEEAADGSDLVLTTGGIGHGAFDVVKLLLGPQGTGTSQFVHLALRPGGPQGVGHLGDGTPVVHLPGTPVGALVGHHLFVRPLLPGGGAALRRVRLEPAAWDRPLRGRPGTVHALPALLGRDAEGWETARPVSGRRLTPYGRADAIVLLTVPDGVTAPPGRECGMGDALALPL